MKRILRLFLPALAVLFFFPGCSKEDLPPDSLGEMEAEWAVACYRDMRSDGLLCWELDLTRGRIGEDLELLSSGFVAHMLLAIPPAETQLPAGRYAGTDGMLPDYSFDAREPRWPAEAGIPYVELRRNSREKAQRYPVEDGELQVTRLPDGSYRLQASLKSQGRTFSLSYEGVIPTYDYTEPL